MDHVLSRPVMAVKSIVPVAGPLWLLSLVIVNVPRKGPKFTPGTLRYFSVNLPILRTSRSARYSSPHRTPTPKGTMKTCRRRCRSPRKSIF